MTSSVATCSATSTGLSSGSRMTVAPTRIVPAPAGEPRECGQTLHLLERGREEVLTHHDETEAGVARGPDLVDVLAEAIDHGHARGMLLGDDQAEVHVAALCINCGGWSQDRAVSAGRPACGCPASAAA